MRLQHPPIITRTMPALAAAVANVNGLVPYAGTVAAVLFAQFNLKPGLVLHNESRMEKVHEQSAQTLEPCTKQQRGVFFSRPRHLSLPYRYTALRGLSGKSTSTFGPWQRQARAILVYSSTWYTVTVAVCHTKGP